VVNLVIHERALSLRCPFLFFELMKKRIHHKLISLLLYGIVIIACNDSSKHVDPPINEKTFTNPILSSAPDPWVIQYDNSYYVTYTTGNNLELIRTPEMSDVSQGQLKTIWTPPATGLNSKNIWAPELHQIDGKWYFYYAADDGTNENHRMWVLENSGSDPFAGTWTDKGQVLLPDNKWAIDGTILQLQGQFFFLWSGWEGDQNLQQNIYICKMTNPWTSEGERIILSQPTFSWEKSGGPPFVNEAPQWLVHDNKIFITYSASGCWTDDYVLGLLSAEINSNLLDPQSWTKSQAPVFAKNPSALAYAPGHNCFFKSKDGSEDWLTYHANDQSGEGCGDARSMRMQKLTWTNNQPSFGQPVAVGLSIPVPSGEN
jgi:GH43 family beta-xylosidase